MEERPGTDQPQQDEPLIPDMVRRASRFSREFIATVIALVTTAFGVVVALAWNTALSKALAQLSRAYQITGLFMYAVIVTIVAVLTVISLGRLAARIDAEPVEFKYPAAKKDS